MPMACAWPSSSEPRESRSRASCRSKRSARSSQTTDCDLEIFVHGALCVAYSGQCFSSEAWGGRSANRGQCAQACRLPYELIVDDELQPLDDARYLLSPGDLYALHHVPEIVEIGISALKIEGRYKDADYVALTTRAYRKAVDDAVAGYAAHASRPRKSCSSNRCTRADSAHTSSPARIIKPSSMAARPAIAACLMGTVTQGRERCSDHSTCRCKRYCAIQAGRRRGVRRRIVAQPGRARRGRAHLRRQPSSATAV